MNERRVRDLVLGDLGTVVDGPFRGGRYRVAWDEPTRYQDEARPRIPSEHFAWVGGDTQLNEGVR